MPKPTEAEKFSKTLRGLEMMYIYRKFNIGVGALMLLTSIPECIDGALKHSHLELWAGAFSMAFASMMLSQVSLVSRFNDVLAHYKEAGAVPETLDQEMETSPE